MSMNTTLRWRAAVLAALAAACLALASCNDTAPSEVPGNEQEQDDGGY